MAKTKNDVERILDKIEGELESIRKTGYTTDDPLRVPTEETIYYEGKEVALKDIKTWIKKMFWKSKTNRSEISMTWEQKEVRNLKRECPRCGSKNLTLMEKSNIEPRKDITFVMQFGCNQCEKTFAEIYNVLYEKTIYHVWNKS